MKKILVVDIGGSSVKLKVSDKDEVRKFPSGSEMTGLQMVEGVKSCAAGWEYEAVTIGYPGPVVDNHILQEPVNLGVGWMHVDFSAAMERSVKVLNDAAMQAVGSYQGGRMLFLGLGTGLGNTLILNGFIAPMELGHLPYKKKTFEDYVGEAGRKRVRRKKWEAAVFDVVARLKAALVVDYVVLGGGNAKRLRELPPDCRLGDNANAFVGGARLWEEGGFTM